MGDFKPGDVVRLKSGGPKMTVKWAGNDQITGPVVCCTWFDGMKPVSETFPPDTLESDQKTKSGSFSSL